MMTVKLIIYTLIFSLFTSVSVFSQNYDILELNAGAKLNGFLTPKIQNFTEIDRINWVSDKGKDKKIPLKAIKSIVDANGIFLYPVPEKVEIIKEEIKLADYDTVYLKAGGKIACNLDLSNNNLADLDRIPYLSVKNENKSIPLRVIERIVNRRGKQLYPTVIKETPKPIIPPKPIIDCQKETSALKLQISDASLNRYNEIIEEIKLKTTEYTPATSKMEETLIQQVYNSLKYKIEALKENSTSVDAVLTIKVNKNGKLEEHSDKINKYQELEYYTKLRDTEIYPHLETRVYATNEIEFDYSGEYEKLFAQFENQIKSSKCPNEFDQVLSSAKEKFNSLQKGIISSNTIYKIPINYNFSVVTEKWSYHKGELTNRKVETEKEIADERAKISFLEFIKFKQKNGIYEVNANYYSMLGSRPKIAVNSVKRKYKYLSHYGLTTQAHLSLQGDRVNSGLGVFTYNAKIIVRRVGFFAGGMYNLYDVNDIVKVDPHVSGRFINKKMPLYVEGGLYLGIAQYFFLKGGYTYYNDEIESFENSVKISKKPETHHGFIAGMALIFPFFHLEWGYNYFFNSIYLGAGLHVTLNQ